MNFTEALLTIFSPLILAGTGWLGAKAAELIQAKVKNERLRRVLLRLDDAVVTAVTAVHQTMGEELKAASANGRLGSEKRRYLKETAVRLVKDHLGPRMLDELEQVLGLWRVSLDDLIASKVEASVHDLRRADAGRARAARREPEPAHPAC